MPLPTENDAEFKAAKNLIFEKAKKAIGEKASGMKIENIELDMYSYFTEQALNMAKTEEEKKEIQQAAKKMGFEI